MGIRHRDVGLHSLRIALAVFDCFPVVRFRLVVAALIAAAALAVADDSGIRLENVPVGCMYDTRTVWVLMSFADSDYFRVVVDRKLVVSDFGIPCFELSVVVSADMHRLRLVCSRVSYDSVDYNCNRIYRSVAV